MRGQRPALLPHTDHVFFSDYLLVIELTVAFGQIPLILIHEVFHVLAARRLGVAARIGIGHRMYFVVFETVMDGLVVVPREKRYLPMLAGMLADFLIVCALTLVAALASTPGGPPSLVAGVCLALAFTTLIRFALEFLLFLRTDVYYLICTLTGTIDLHTTSTEIVANRWWRLRRPQGAVARPGPLASQRRAGRPLVHPAARARLRLRHPAAAGGAPADLLAVPRHRARPAGTSRPGVGAVLGRPRPAPAQRRPARCSPVCCGCVAAVAASQRAHRS